MRVLSLLGFASAGEFWIPASAGMTFALLSVVLVEASSRSRSFVPLSSENPTHPTTYPQTLSPSQEALFSLVSSFGASCPLLSSSCGSPAEPGLYTGEALLYAALELAELRGEL